MIQYQEKTTVLRVERFTDDLCRLTLAAPQIAVAARPGQFVMIRTSLGHDPLLRRPFSIHQTSTGGTVQIYFKVVGRGTNLLSRVREGEELSVFGPLGKGFKLLAERPAVLVGGGLGIAPLLFLAKELSLKKAHVETDYILLGARAKEELTVLVEDFRQFGMHVRTATDDGSLGYQGFVTDLLSALQLANDAVVYTCGPEPMMARTVAICRSAGVECQVSVESVMACGMGACLGCTRPASDGGYTHVCKNGPVYNAEDLQWKM
jgi:dihydroorotate dehydrogenase electron transfer subunit